MKSLSDNNRYPDFCYKAATDSETFNHFRRNPDYRAILEHVTEQQGKQYLELIDSIQSEIPYFMVNDTVGDPIMYNYDGLIISPTTLRYGKVLNDLFKLFGNLNGMRICEIGVGYGGQCRVIHSVFHPKSYTLVDIAPALMLTKRYLDSFPIDGVMSFKTMSELDFSEYDLVISNYAFSELPGPIQSIYISKVINRSKHGYMILNDINPPEFESYKASDILRFLKDNYIPLPGLISIEPEILPEEPLTHPRNSLLVW